jgi:hypothetical protein
MTNNFSKLEQLTEDEVIKIVLEDHPELRFISFSGWSSFLMN